MRVLVACEFSGIVRDALKARGHNAWSCDLLPTERPGQHIQGDVLDILEDGWDLMIAHPPCQHLAVSGARWFKDKVVEQRDAVVFFLHLAECSIPKIAVENPVGVMSRHFRKPDQIIHPWEFGHQEEKTTCLWLKKLPKLVPTNIVGKGEFVIHGGRKLPKWYSNCHGKTYTYYRCASCGLEFGEILGKYGCVNCCTDDGPPAELKTRRTSRRDERSRTYQGIADAMAAQWGGDGA